jgi:Tfp pilus assembly protein PilF
VNYSNDGRDEAWLGYQALEQHQYPQALRWCGEAIRIQPTLAGAWYNLGIAHQHLNHLKEAASAYRRAAQLAPSDKKFREAADMLEGV